jgi:hypothetical protein
MIELEELNNIILELTEVYNQKIQYIVNQTPIDQDPDWKLVDLEELRKIGEQLKLVSKIRDNCIQVFKDLELLKSYSS